MPSRAGTLVLALFSILASLPGCDSSSEWEGCVASEAPGARRDACPASQFAAEHYRSREVSGTIRRGEDPVPGALVRIEPAPGFASSPTGEIATTVTDEAGTFTGLRPVALRYDLAASLARPGSSDRDVLAFQGLAYRRLEPSLEGPRVFARSWSSRIDVQLDRVVPSDRSLAFYANGEGVYGVRGDMASGLVVLARDYSATGTLHVVEYETAGGLETATAYGKADFIATAGGTLLASVALAPIELVAEPTFDVSVPPGVTPGAVEIRFGFSRTSDGVLATVPVGTSRPLRIIPNSGYSYRLVATDGAATLDTGETGFDILKSPTTITLPAAPVTAAPREGEAIEAGGTLLADGVGVFEHVLTPKAGGPSVRVVTSDHAARLPDLAKLGLRAAGEYAWTVRAYPTARFPDELAWPDARRYRPVGTSAARTIVLR